MSLCSELVLDLLWVVGDFCVDYFVFVVDEFVFSNVSHSVYGWLVGWLICWWLVLVLRVEMLKILVECLVAFADIYDVIHGLLVESVDGCD